MASPIFPETILAISLLFLLSQSQPAYSLTCETQTFTNKTFKNCVDLPYLSAYLHWTYDETESSLSMGYVAPPAQPNGWISWGINPNGTHMVGTQALIAFKQSNGKMTVNQFQLISYTNVVEEKLQFKVSDLSAGSSEGNMMFFAKWKLPKNKTQVNQVWQQGPGVDNDGKPQVHALTGNNLKSFAPLDLLQVATAPAGAPPPGSGGNSDGGRSLMQSVGISGLLVVGALAFSF